MPFTLAKSYAGEYNTFWDINYDSNGPIPGAQTYNLGALP